MDIEIKDLHVNIEEKEIVKGVSLKVGKGEFHVIMGPNGSGKSTLAKAIMGHPKLKITGGEILADGTNISEMPANERARMGIFLQFQNPIEIEGVGFVNFLHTAKRSIAQSDVDVNQFMGDVDSWTKKLKITNGIVGRSLNQGFSGGEKKKAEVLQLAVLKPKLAILDEPDSGLDIDAIKIVAENVNELAQKHEMGLIVITHYSRILSYMKPQFVHVMVDGKIVAEGREEMIAKLEKEGYEQFVKK
ncbi:MAG: Fe-S cluster assembly ATPase SufC [Candidatus Micrarchaeota archaeon]|nr:Fe-S cluster assembly ATPase SufC [Candidatus Micrarchaeota archaeon]MDE1804383.1 Fe-S cluster assembly ATPase SufC [Candidatus Micrarchaeota archaeon]